jgi:hypothetical protein
MIERYHADMEKVIHRTSLKSLTQDRDYWLSRPVEERIAAVELLRQQMHGPSNARRMQVVCKVRHLKYCSNA